MDRIPSQTPSGRLYGRMGTGERRSVHTRGKGGCRCYLACSRGTGSAGRSCLPACERARVRAHTRLSRSAGSRAMVLGSPETTGPWNSHRSHCIAESNAKASTRRGRMTSTRTYLECSPIEGESKLQRDIFYVQHNMVILER